MKKNLFTMLMIACVLFAASCSKDEVEEPTLTLSETGTIDFPKAASEKAVTVTTNQAEWTAMANADWVELTQSGNTLTIKVGENMETEKRKAEVIVMAGGLGRKLMVEQSKADNELEITPDKVTIAQKGEEKVIDIKSNSADWTVELSETVDWLTLVKKNTEIKVIAKENKTEAARTVKLIAKSGSKAIEIVVTQFGLTKFIIPFQGPFTERGLFDLEFSRGSYFLAYSAPLPSWGFPEADYTFVTPSNLFGQIQYSILPGANTYKKAIVFGPNPATVEAVLSGEFDKFMIEKGFKKTKDGDTERSYTNENGSVICNATIKKGIGVTLNFTVIPVQPKDYPTFDKLPTGLKDWVGDPAKKVADVDKWEADQSSKLASKSMSTLNPNQLELAIFNTGKSPEAARVYFYICDETGKKKDPALLQSLEEVGLMFDKPNLAFWQNGSEWIMTKEFKALLEKEKYTFDRISSNGSYIYKKDNMYLGASCKRYNGILDGIQVFHLAYFIPSLGIVESIDAELLKAGDLRNSRTIIDNWMRKNMKSYSLKQVQ